MHSLKPRVTIRTELYKFGICFFNAAYDIKKPELFTQFSQSYGMFIYLSKEAHSLPTGESSKSHKIFSNQVFLLLIIVEPLSLLQDCIF